MQPQGPRGLGLYEQGRGCWLMQNGQPVSTQAFLTGHSQPPPSSRAFSENEDPVWGFCGGCVEFWRSFSPRRAVAGYILGRAASWVKP